jgi:hypothetical protein
VSEAAEVVGLEVSLAEKRLTERGVRVEVRETAPPERSRGARLLGERWRVIQQRQGTEGMVLVVGREIALQERSSAPGEERESTGPVV